MKVRSTLCGWFALFVPRLTMYFTELDYIFAVPTRRHMSYQTGTVLPYWIKTQILRRKGLTPPRLYKFNDDAADVDRIVGTGKLGTATYDKSEMSA